MCSRRRAYRNNDGRFIRSLRDVVIGSRARVYRKRINERTACRRRAARRTDILLIAKPDSRT